MKRVISWLLVILWMALIFYLSHQPATESNSLSTGITERIVTIIERVTSDIDFDVSSFNHIVRKNAHFFAYLILGVLVSNALKNNDFKGTNRFLIALAICVLYAISDEIHQLFIPGRAGQVRDIIIDSAGVVVGISAYLEYGKLKK